MFCVAQYVTCSPVVWGKSLHILKDSRLSENDLLITSAEVLIYPPVFVVNTLLLVQPISFSVIKF